MFVYACHKGGQKHKSKGQGKRNTHFLIQEKLRDISNIKNTTSQNN